MSQANPFMIVAAEDKELYADELAVLRQKLGAFKEALRRCFEKDPENVQRWNKYLLDRLHEYDVNLNNMNRFKKRRDFVGFVDEYEFDNGDKYDEEVEKTATEFLRYWKEKAQPGTQRLHNFDKDRPLTADELVVLKQKLRAFRQAFIVYMIAEPDKQKHAERNRNILIKLHEFDLNFDAPLKLKRTKRAEVVVFVNEQKLLDAEKYGKDVAQKATEFLRYWKQKAQPGAQV